MKPTLRSYYARVLNPKLIAVLVAITAIGSFTARSELMSSGDFQAGDTAIIIASAVGVVLLLMLTLPVVFWALSGREE